LDGNPKPEHEWPSDDYWKGELCREFSLSSESEDDLETGTSGESEDEPETGTSSESEDELETGTSSNS